MEHGGGMGQTGNRSAGDARVLLGGFLPPNQIPKSSARKPVPPSRAGYSPLPHYPIRCCSSACQAGLSARGQIKQGGGKWYPSAKLRRIPYHKDMALGEVFSNRATKLAKLGHMIAGTGNRFLVSGRFLVLCMPPTQF